MGIFRNVSGIFITLCIYGTFKTLVYLEPRHIRNPGAYSKACQNIFDSVLRNYHYIRDISFSRFLLYETNIIKFLNTGLIFTPEVFILRKKVWGPIGLRALDFDIPFTITVFH